MTDAPEIVVEPSRYFDVRVREPVEGPPQEVEPCSAGLPGDPAATPAHAEGRSETQAASPQDASEFRRSTTAAASERGSQGPQPSPEGSQVRRSAFGEASADSADPARPDLDAVWRELGFTPGAKPDALGRLLALIRQTARETARQEVLSGQAEAIFAASRPEIPKTSHAATVLQHGEGVAGKDQKGFPRE